MCLESASAAVNRYPQEKHGRFQPGHRFANKNDRQNAWKMAYPHPAISGGGIRIHPLFRWVIVLTVPG